MARAKVSKKGDKSITEKVTITPPNFKRAKFKIVGTTPFVQLKFSQKVQHKIEESMQEGSLSMKKRKARPPRDFEAQFKDAQHVSLQGWVGHPCSAIRNGMISVCRLVGFAMTVAKLTVFIEADGRDAESDVDLFRIYGEPEMFIAPVRNADGSMDLRSRAKWNTWHAEPVLRWDADMFTTEDVVNLLARVGLQAGLGEGRPDSKKSNGQGWGHFAVELMEIEDV